MMRLSLHVCLLLLTPAILASPAVARASDAVTWTPDGEGGVAYTIWPAGLRVESAAARASASHVELPYTSTWRLGCHVVSPPVFVGHGNGRAEFAPDLRVSWIGLYDGTPGQEDSSWVLGLRLSVRRPGESPRIVDRPVRAVDLPLGPYAETQEGTVYQGVRESSFRDPQPLAVRTSVHEGDTVEASICVLGPGTRATVRSFHIHTLPTAEGR